MKRIYYFLFLVICLSTSFAIAHEITRFSIENKTSRLNRLVADKSFLYISNIPNAINEVSGGGFISKLDKYGNVVESHFIDKLDYPEGMVIINNVLYVVDSGKIKGFNLKTKRQVFNLKMNDAMLGDIIAWDNNTLLAIDVDGLILSVDIKKKSYNVFMRIELSFGIPYFLARYGDKLYVATLYSDGRILRIDTNTKDISYMSELSGRFYGIAITKNGGILAIKDESDDDGLYGRDSNQSATMLYNINSQGQIFIVDLQDFSTNIFTLIVDSNDVWCIDMAGVELIRISI